MDMFMSWLQNFRSKKTRETYRFAMQKFVEFKTDKTARGIDPEDIDAFVKEYLDGLEDKDTYLGDIKGYLNYLNENVTPKTLNVYITAVKEFFKEKAGYEVEDSEWNRLKRRGQIPKGEKVSRDKILSKKQLRKVINHLDSFGRSIILYMLSSGCRVGEAVQLKVEDLRLDESPPRADLDRTYTKNRRARTVFMTDEAKESIKEWLEIRKDRDKPTPPYLKNGKKENETYDTDRIWNTQTDNVRKRWNLALEKAGLDEKDRKTGRYIYHLHTLRKYFRSKPDLEKETVETLLGHQSELDRAYNKISEESLAQSYETAQSPLCIYETNRDKKKQLKTAINMQGLSMQEAVEMFNEMGFNHSETNEPYTPSNLATEDTKRIGEMMKVSRAKEIEKENNLMEKVIERNKDRDMESLAKEGLEKLKEINENDEVGNIDGVDELIEKLEN